MTREPRTRVRAIRDQGRFVVEIARPQAPLWVVVAAVDLLLVAGFAWLLVVFGSSEALTFAGPLLALPAAASGFFVAESVFLLAWLTTGRDVAEIQGHWMTLTTRALGATWWRREYDLRHVTLARYEPVSGVNREFVLSLPRDRGLIAFDYGLRTVHFGRWMRQDEAELAIEALNPELKAASDAARKESPDGAVPPLMQRPRYGIRRTPEGLELRLPFGMDPYNLRSTAFLLVDLSAAASLFTLSMPGVPLPEADAVWRVSSGIGVLIALSVVVSVLAPVERVRLASGRLTVRVTPVVLSWIPPQHYDVRYIHNLRPWPRTDEGLMAELLANLTGRYGRIAMGYGAEQHFFGRRLDGPEAQAVADAINAVLDSDPSAGSLAWEAYHSSLPSTASPGPEHT